MARKASPWYWEERDGWYVNIDGERHRLGEHPEGAAAPKKSTKTGKWNAPIEIEAAFHKLMTGGGSQAPIVLGGDAVVTILDDFLAWCFENREESTAERYQRFCQDFVRDYGRLPVADLTAKQVTDWLADRPTWNSTTKRNAITALQRAFNWASKNRGLERNPLRGMEKPEAKRRSSIITPAAFETVLRHVRDEAFRDLLIVSYDCGCRPQEVKRLEGRHLQGDSPWAVIPASEAKGRKKQRTIYFPTQRVMKIIARLAQAYPTGPIFRNSKGNVWTAFAVKCRFRAIETSTGVEQMKEKEIESAVTKEAVELLVAKLKPTKVDRVSGKEVPKKPHELRKEAKMKLLAAEANQHGIRLYHYQFRRTWITRKLLAGVDSHVVAKLSGHANTDMIDRHYSVVAADHEFMLKEAMKDIKPKKAKK